MATSDGRGPPSAGDTRENPTGEALERSSERGPAGAPSPPRRPPAPPRRTTGGIPAQNGQPRRATNSIPIVESDIVDSGPRRTGQIPVQSAAPRRPTNGIPAQAAPPERPRTPTAQPKRPTLEAPAAVADVVDEETSPHALLPVERPPSKSGGSVPRRPSQTMIPTGRKPTNQLIPAQGQPPERPTSNPGNPRRASQTAIPVQPDKPKSLLEHETSPKALPTSLLELPTDAGELERTSADVRPLHARTEARSSLDEITDPTDPAREARKANGSTEVQPALDPGASDGKGVQLPWDEEPEVTPQLSPMPTPRQRNAGAPVSVLEDSTRVGEFPDREDTNATATQPLPRMDRQPEHSDPEKTSAMPDLAAQAALSQIRAELKQADAAKQLPGARSSELSDKPSKRVGAFSRSADVARKLSSPAIHELSRVIRLEAMKNAAGSVHGFQVAIGLVMLVLGGAASLAFFLGHGDRPPLETLQVQYPYGFSGGRQPNGRAAPPASQVVFDFKTTIDCGDDVCVRYLAHSADNSFQLTMDLRKDGPDWKLVGGDGPNGAQGVAQ